MKEFTLSGPGWFDNQPDPVIWARQDAVAYFNPAAAELARRCLLYTSQPRLCRLY